MRVILSWLVKDNTIVRLIVFSHHTSEVSFSPSPHYIQVFGVREGRVAQSGTGLEKDPCLDKPLGGSRGSVEGYLKGGGCAKKHAYY
jgi:hypothetical protein